MSDRVQSSASLSRIASMARRRRRRAGQEQPARIPPTCGAEPERLLDSPTYEGFPIRPLYTGLDALPEPPLPGQWPFVRGGDALRDVKSGWKVAEAFPLPGSRPVADGNGAVLVALTEGVSALVLRVGAHDGVAAADLDRLLEGVFLELVPVIARRGRGLRRRRRRACWRWSPTSTTSSARTPVDRSRRRSADRAAERTRRAVDVDEVVATAAKADRLRRRRAGDHRRRARVPRSRCQRVVGAGRRRRRRRRVPAAARRRRRRARGCVAADQLPLRRRRRPVHDDREAACGAPALGPGRRGRRRARRRCGDRPRRDVAADDGAARPVGEHAAHHARGLRRGCRRCGHRAGARRSTPRSPADCPAPQRVSRAGWRATPSCCCWRSRTSAGSSTPAAGRGSSRT